MSKIGSRKKAIDKFCKECVYDAKASGIGTWRKQVEDCCAPKCALYPFRPTTTNEAEIEQSETQDERKP